MNRHYTPWRTAAQLSVLLTMFGAIMPAQALPVADPGGPYSGLAGETIRFDGSGSYSASGVLVDYIWIFGDGNGCCNPAGPNALVTHSYASAGEYQVQLIVIDSTDSFGEATTTASIGPAPGGLVPPVADAGGPYSGNADSPVTFDGTGSYAGNGVLVDWAWSFGDGLGSSGTSPTVGHSYTAPGTYGVTLAVTDSYGLQASAATSASVAAAVGLDIDIVDLVTDRRFRVGRDSAIAIAVAAQNVGSVTGTAVASVVGTQNGVIVYAARQMISGESGGNKAPVYSFPSHVPSGTAEIVWTATVSDGDPDDDTATAATQIR